MKITFLGTGTSQGIPIIGSKHEVCLSTDSKDKRLRSSILLAWEGATYVIDCGPDFRQQLLRAGVDQLDGILFTHYHADHTAGLDDSYLPIIMQIILQGLMMSGLFLKKMVKLNFIVIHQFQRT